MANWTNIPTDRIEPGKPIRAIDGLALRDNPIAIAEGASGAPKIREEAISTNSINGNRLRTNSVPNDRLTNNSITGAKLNDGSIRSWIGSQSRGAVGTYLYAWKETSGTVNSGATTAGSSLRLLQSFNNFWAPSGTWRNLGSYTEGGGATSGIRLWLRIS